MPPEAEGGPAEQPSYGIGAVERTLDVVAALMRVGPATLTHLAAESGCTRVNAFRILHTLQERGLAIQIGRRGAWQLGAGWLTVARVARQQGAMPAAANAIMRSLADTGGDSVYLGVRDGQECEIAAVHQGSAATHAYYRAGDRASLHVGPGKLLLAHASEPIQRAVLGSRLVRAGPGVRLDAASITGELDRIRKRDWLITSHEIAEGAISVTCPVRDATGAVVAALTIASPAIRMRPPRPHTLLSPLQAASILIGRALSGKGSPGTDAL